MTASNISSALTRWMMPRSRRVHSAAEITRGTRSSGNGRSWPDNEKVIPWLTGRGLDAPRHAPLAVVWLPDGYDPGTMDRRFMRRYVEREALGQGVKVSWELR